jgi:hypothetical protein
MNAGTDPNYGQQRQQTDCEVVLAGSGRFQAAFLRENSSQYIVHLSPPSKLSIYGFTFNSYNVCNAALPIQSMRK